MLPQIIFYVGFAALMGGVVQQLLINPYIKWRIEVAVSSLRQMNYSVMENFSYAMHVAREIEAIVFEKEVIGVKADYGDMTFMRSGDFASLNGKTVGVEYSLILVNDGRSASNLMYAKQGHLTFKIPNPRRGLFSGPTQAALELELDLNHVFTPADRGQLMDFFMKKKAMQVAP